MSTGTELSTLLTTYLHNDVNFTAADKLTYINLGLKRICRDYPEGFLRKVAAITTADDTQEYSLAADFNMMIGVWETTNGRKIYPMAPSEFIEEVEAQTDQLEGLPQRYTILGFSETTGTWRIKFDYEQDAAGSISYAYYPLPVTVTANVTPGLSTRGYDELILWAAAMIALEPKDPQGFQMAAAAYERNLSQFMKHRPMGPDYTAQFRPADSVVRSGGYLGPHYPIG